MHGDPASRLTPTLGLAVIAVAACGAPAPSNGFGEDASADGGLALESGGGDAGGSRDAGRDSGLRLQGDGQAKPDSGHCKHLDIGILGNPGADASSDFQSWLVSAGTSVTRIQTTAPTPTVTAATLAPFDVVILDWLTRDYASAEASVLADYVSAGGGVISMSGYDGSTTDDWHANSLLSPLAVAYTGSLLNGPVTSFATHPITAGLTSITFAGGYAVEDLGGTASTRTPIAFLPDPSGSGTVPVAFAVSMGAGRAFVWGDEWIEFDSQWSTMPEINQLWIQVFAWVAPMNGCKLHPPA